MGNQASGSSGSSSRRNFIKATGALRAGLVAQSVVGKASGLPALPLNPATPDAIFRRWTS
jgi:hypothetical protein